MLRLKGLFLFFLLSLNLFAIDVIVVTKDINYKEMLSKDKLSLQKASSVKKHCEPLTLAAFNSKKYLAARFLKRGTILCTKDVDNFKQNSIVFDFGPIQIEKQGKIIYENDEYIKIKRYDGEVEKIYKDGRIE